jgi:dihydroneopterin aldolase
MSSLHYSLNVDRLRLSLHIGCTAEEQASPQPIEISYRLTFPTRPKGCESDDLNGTYCFESTCSQIQAIATEKRYQLIEHLGWRVYEVLKSIVAPDIQVWVKITKCHPPVAHLEGPAEFVISDTAGA